MEQLDSDLEYTLSEPRPSTPGSRVNALLIFPILGALLIVVFICAAIFQWNLSDLIDSLVGVLLLLFFAFIAMLFWALYPRTHQAG
jgi:UDP-N-acetylmuramyl pentapeptide phosphotransferase/UDP-N-acetylglucosamine-1-phosphate transferase